MKRKFGIGFAIVSGLFALTATIGFLFLVTGIVHEWQVPFYDALVSGITGCLAYGLLEDEYI